MEKIFMRNKLPLFIKILLTGPYTINNIVNIHINNIDGTILKRVLIVQKDIDIDYQSLREIYRNFD